MKLNEAKQILNKAGFLVEDTDTLQDRIDAASSDIHLARKRHDGPGYKKAIDDFCRCTHKSSCWQSNQLTRLPMQSSSMLVLMK